MIPDNPEPVKPSPPRRRRRLYDPKPFVRAEQALRNEGLLPPNPPPDEPGPAGNGNPADPTLLNGMSELAFYGAVAHQFAKQNEGLDLAFVPAEGPEGKIPCPVIGGIRGGPYPLDGQHFLSPTCTGYGIVLSKTPSLLVIDIDDRTALNPQAAAMLDGWEGLTYKTAKGRHYICDHEDGPPLFLDKTFGQVWQAKPRFVALTGSKGKNFPEQGDYRIHPAPDFVNELLEELTRHPNRIHQQYGGNRPAGGRHGYYLTEVGEMMRRWPDIPNSDIIDNLKPSEAYKSKAAEQGEPAVIKEIRRIADDFRNKQQQHIPPEDDIPEHAYDEQSGGTEQTYEGPGNIRLGDLTIIGQQILIDNQIVDYLKGYPRTKEQLPARFRPLYEQYINFYNQAVIIPVPKPIRIYTDQELTDYNRTIPEPYNIKTPDGNGNIIIPAKEWTLLVARKKQGKTWAAMTIAAELPGRSIYIATEGLTAIEQRIRMLGKNRFLNKVLFHNRPDAARVRELAEQADLIEAEVVFVDVIAPFLEDELKASSFNDFERILLPLTENRTVVLVHHYGQDQSKGARGTTRIEDAVGYGYRIERDNPPDSNYTRIVIRPDDNLDRLGLKAAGAELRIGQEQTGFTATLAGIKKPAARGNTAEVIKAWHQAYAKTQTTKTGGKKYPTERGMTEELHAIAGGTANAALIRIKGAINDGLFQSIPAGGATGAVGYNLVDKTT